MSDIKPFDEPPPVPPDEPDAFACCGNDCGEACVWTIYQHARRRYETLLLAWQERQLAQEEPAKPGSGA